MSALLGTAGDVRETGDMRRWERHYIDVSARVYRKGKTGFVLARGTALSEGGMALYAATEYEIGEEVEIEAQLPYDSETVRLAAIVRNRRSYCYGVEFTKPNPQLAAMIERACRVLGLVQ